MKQNTIRCTLLFIILVFVFSCNAKAETVKDEIISLAKSGEVDYQILLGYYYLYGKEGVSQDFDKAFYWFNAAAKKVQTDNEHYNVLVFHLGLCYYDGLGTEENYNQAVRWFKLGANRGDALSQYYLGLCYYDGLGVEEDAKKALEWYLKSAEQDCLMAQCSLGVLYLNGDGVPKDEKQGVYWLSIAADKGDAEAQTNLAFYYLVDKQDTL